MAFDPKQWRREKGSKRGYINDVTGQRLSRRKYDELKGGPKPDTNMQRVYLSKKGTRQYRQLVKERVLYLEEKGEKTNFNKVKSSLTMKELNKQYKWSKSEKNLWHKYFQNRKEKKAMTPLQLEKLRALSQRRRKAMEMMGQIPKDGDPYVNLGF